MDLRRLRRRCEARLRALTLPTPFDVETFCADLAARRGRSIVLRPIAMTEELTGMWVGGAFIDLIVYERETSPLHQEHFVLHELSHLLCGHQSTVSEADVAKLSLLDRHDVSVGAVQYVLHRSTYTSEEDQEAEILASLIMEHAVHARDHGGVPPAGAPARPLAPLDAVLEEGMERPA